MEENGNQSDRPKTFRQKLRNEVRLRGTEIPFLIFMTFLIAFVSVRTYVWLFSIPEATHLQTNIFGYRIHHYWWGIVLLSIAGWLAITHKGKNVDRTAAILYGLGLGLIMDEAGLLLTEHSNYYSLSTYSLVLSIILLLLSIVFFPLFWTAVKRELRERRDKVVKVTHDIVDEIEDGGKWATNSIKGVFHRNNGSSGGGEPPENKEGDVT